MTPERLAEIREFIALWVIDPDDTTVKEAAIIDLLADNDSLTAEIATLRAQRDALETVGGAVVEDAFESWAYPDPIGTDCTVVAQRVVDKELIDALSAAVAEAKGRDREFCIIINGKVLRHDRDVLTYDDVFRWYSMGHSFQSEVLLTVTFSNGPKENPFGSLMRGQGICVCDGLIINVTIT